MKIFDEAELTVAPVFLIRKAFWKIIRRDGREIVKLVCPTCKLEAALDHEIDPSGRVLPSVDCPNPACNFHVVCKLEGWEKTKTFVSKP